MRFRHILLSIHVIVCISLSGGQLDPRLNRLKSGLERAGAGFREQLAEDSTHSHALNVVRKQGDQYVVPTTISLVSTETLDRLGIPYTAITPNIVTADIPISALGELERSFTIRYVRLAHAKETQNDINMSKLKASVPWAKNYFGENVLVGVIDTGIDVSHPGFKVGGAVFGATRIKYLWDQTVSHIPFSVGAFTSTKGQRWNEAEITAGACTQRDTNGHGTHVAGSFFGFEDAFPSRSGAAKKANILIVKSTFLSSDILNGIAWLNEEAKALGKPIIVNLSLGSKSGPHDGTDLDAKAIDDLVESSNGNLIVVRSAGNYGNDGHHGSAIVTTGGVTVPIMVSSYPVETTAYDTLAFDYFYDANADVSVRLTGPGGSTAWMAPSLLPASGTLPDGTGYYIESNSTAEPYNQNIKYLYIELGEISNGDGKWVRPGNWSMEFRTATGSTRIDGWLWYYGGRGQIGASFTAPDSDTTLGNDACGKNVISVAAYISRYSWQASDGATYHYTGFVQDTMAPFSSAGPTRDGRKKPDATAGGSNVLSARSEATSPVAALLPSAGEMLYTFMQGTSMSSPTLAGAVALLKEMHPTWTYADVINYFKSNSQGTALYGGFGTWTKNWGWGVVDLARSVPTGPTINIQPASQTVGVGATATFTVSATASKGNLTYQWIKGGTSLIGANSSSYTTPPNGLPDNGAFYWVVVNDANGSTSSNGAVLTVIAPPVVTSFTPTVGPVGTPVNLTGSNFTGATSVKFNGTSAIFNVVSSTSITTSVPPGASTGPVSVTTAGGTGNSIPQFTITAAPPIIVTVSPDPVTMPIGAQILLTAAVINSSNTSVTWSGSGSAFLSSLTANSTTFTASSSGIYFLTATSVAAPSASATATITVKSRDVNADGAVDILDLALFARAFDATPSSSNWNAACDLNGDGVVNQTDVDLFLAGF